MIVTTESAMLEHTLTWIEEMKARAMIFLAMAAILASTVAAQRGVDLVPSSELGTYHALIIGIDKYQHWPRLDFAERDASDIRQILISDYGFVSSNVAFLPSRQATGSSILAELRSHFNALGPTDNFLIFYAGHGHLDPLTDTGYWVPVDGKVNDEASWISFTRIKDLLTAHKIKAKNVLVITDSCYGGALTRGGPTPGKAKPTNTYYTENIMRLAKKRSRQVMASGGYAQVPDRSDFAELLKQALRKNPYPIVDLEFLFFDEVYPGLTKAGLQRPRMARLTSGPEEDGQFVLMRSDASLGSLAETVSTAQSSGSPAPLGVELTYRNSIRDSQNPAAFQSYLEKYPKGQFATLAKIKLDELAPDDQPRKTIVPRVKGLTSVKLRAAPATISSDAIYQMVRERGFSFPAVNLRGDFRHEYEAKNESGVQVIVDHATGLMWQQSGSVDTMSYGAAQAYVAELNREVFAGFSDWRLPTIEELASLVEPTKKSGDLYLDPIFDDRQRWCRSADKKSPSRSWSIVFYEGALYYPTFNFPYYVRAVRSATP